MVSGLVTSPCDQLRIFSGDARLIRMESNSATALFRSNGLERYKVSSCGLYAAAAAPGFLQFLFQSQPQPGCIPELRQAGWLLCGAEAPLQPSSRPRRLPACGCLQEF